MQPTSPTSTVAAAVPAPAALTTDPAELRAICEEVITRSPFARWMGTRIGDIRPGRVVLQLPVRDDLRQHHGQVHGAVLGYLADTAASWTAATLVGDVVTSEYKINLLAPARGELLEVIGEVVRAGRRQVVSRADVYALDGGRRELVATALATIAVVRPQAKEDAR
ncbi:PaaI family thioesterase [Piscinibacter sp. XHJ-5]|uniref:PaaI family thioesterase n=1 Tax=Piscinibacter sp. XHJ-5 TaxID=3037797 RepID=UPI002452B369|nr:PaaI family thioesterase [Piscinibacter sp. XHJ-5]